MKRIIIVFTIIFTLLLTGCSTNQTSNEELISFGEKSNSLIKRLEEAKIDYEIQNNEVYIKEKDLSKATACCT